MCDSAAFRSSKNLFIQFRLMSMQMISTHAHTHQRKRKKAHNKFKCRKLFNGKFQKTKLHKIY